MPATLVPLTREHLEPAVELLTENYRAEQKESPLLPSRLLDDPAWIRGVLQSKFANSGVAVVEQNRLLGYMVTGGQFPWKGQNVAILNEYCHSAVQNRKRELYQRMYMTLAQDWVDQRIHLHIVRHFAHDAILQETLYQLGFGAFLAERLRDFSAVAEGPSEEIRVEEDVRKLVNIHSEHNAYYPKALIFVQRSADKEEALAELEEHAQDGDLFLVYYEQQEPCAYMIVGESAIDGEGFLLEKTNTAQIKSAYTRPDLRGKGVGTALLQRAIEWSQQQGYERLFVEHESANFYGGNFWRKHFSPFVYASMRYVDCTL